MKNMTAIMHGSDTQDVYQNNSINWVIPGNYHVFIGS